MAARSKPKQKDAPLPATALDAQQRALKEEERKIKERMAKCQKLVEDAPRIKAERDREKREELIRRSARTVRHPGGGKSLPDRRFEVNVAAPAQQRRMRAERRQGRLMFFVLLLTLAAAVSYLYYTVTQG